MGLYLKIENPGVAPAEAFTMFGPTTKRGIANPLIIGMFGSGSTHGINVLLRNDICPVLYCGNERLEFYTEPMEFKGRECMQVCVKRSGKNEQGKQINKTERLSMTLEFGGMDWNSLSMALREFVSNAFDAVFEGYTDLTSESPKSQLIKAIRETTESVKLEIVDESDMRAKGGYTRVYVPLTAEVQEFYDNRARWFLHFNEPASVVENILPKNNREFERDKQTPCVYRRGVFVRQYEGSSRDSLFDYNFGAELKIDESRNCDDYVIRGAIGKSIKRADKVKLTQFLLGVNRNPQVFEADLSSGSFTNTWDDSDEDIKRYRENWQGAFASAFGEKAVALADGTMAAALAERLTKKGFNPIALPDCWYLAAKAYGVPADVSILSDDEQKGITYHPVTPTVEACVDYWWNLIVERQLNNGKSKPVAGCFYKIMEGDAQTLAFYKPGTNEIYIHTDYANSPGGLLDKAVLEELAHYVSGATDMSRGFQDWLIRFAVALSRCN